MLAPLVSCIMPTGRRLSRLPQALKLFAAQDYPNKELVVVDDGEESAEAICSSSRETVRFIRLSQRVTIGEARNIACDAALGSIICHLDDDDWYAPWHISHHASLLVGDIAITGLRNLTYLDARDGKVWRYTYFGGDHWLAGGTFVYRKLAWRALPFPAVQIGEDTRWIRQQPAAITIPSLRESSFVGLIHSANTCRKKLESSVWQPAEQQRLPIEMLPELPFYLAR